MSIIDNIKGAIGETVIAGRLNLNNLLSSNEGKILRNIYVPKDDATSTEIDLLYITSKGIFVIESKNYVGYIFGKETDQKWTVSVYKGKNSLGKIKTEKYQFFNPIIQNQVHIKWLRKYLNADVQMFSVIVFSDKSEIKKVDVSSSDVIVCYSSKLRRHLKQIMSSTPDLLTETQITEIYSKLGLLTHQSKDVKRNHVEEINKKQSATICPICGSPLVIRTARQGQNVGKQFYGCSGYPNCRYTRNI